jgi:hypothetical protein
MTEKQTTQIPTLNFNKEYSTMDLRRWVMLLKKVFLKQVLKQ